MHVRHLTLNINIAHKTQAEAVFSLLKTKEPGLFVISFDMQRNLPLPKLPDQIVTILEKILLQLNCSKSVVLLASQCRRTAIVWRTCLHDSGNRLTDFPLTWSGMRLSTPWTPSWPAYHRAPCLPVPRGFAVMTATPVE